MNGSNLSNRKQIYNLSAKRSTYNGLGYYSTIGDHQYFSTQQLCKRDKKRLHLTPNLPKFALSGTND